MIDLCRKALVLIPDRRMRRHRHGSRKSAVHRRIGAAPGERAGGPSHPYDLALRRAPGSPFYARTAPPPEPIYVVDGWAVIQFYRDPACIRADFNLLAYFDPPAAFGCTLLVEGFALREPSSVPKVVRQTGIGPVPFWFVPADEMRAAIQDGVLTIGELAGLPGRLVGHASSFDELEHASAPPQFGDGGHHHPMLSQSARGTLEDGRDFEYHLTEIRNRGDSDHAPLRVTPPAR